MSDPVTNIEIEDVLSSIRRLVSEEARKPSAEKQTNPPESNNALSGKLVLTQALRVPSPEVEDKAAESTAVPAEEASEPESPQSDSGQTRHADEILFQSDKRVKIDDSADVVSDISDEIGIDAEADTAAAPVETAENESETIEDEVEASLAQDPMTVDAEPPEDSSDLEMDEVEASTAVDDALDEADAVESTDDGDRQPWENPDKTLYAAAAEADVEDEETLEADESAMGETGEIETVTELAESQTDSPEPASDTALEPAMSKATDVGSALDALEDQFDAQAPEEEDIVEAPVPDEQPLKASTLLSPFTGSRDFGGNGSDQDTLPEPSELPTLDTIETLTQKIAAVESRVQESSESYEPDEPGTSDYAGTPISSVPWQQPEEPVKTEDAASVAAEEAEQDAEEARREAQEANADIFSTEETLLDEESLRELVTDIVREELQGALGERITRNVRKLVRREIQRALAAKELE